MSSHTTPPWSPRGDNSYPEGLRRRAEQALARYDRARDASETLRREPPREGDVFAFAATAELEHVVLWALIRHDPEEYLPYLVVAADHHRLVGSADVAVPAESDCGALTLRCGFSLSLEAEHFREAKRVGALPKEILRRARSKWTEIEAKEPCGSALEEQNDEEWEYRYGLRRELEKARSLLSASFESLHPLVVEVLKGQWVREAIALSLIAAWARKARIDEDDLRFLRQAHKAASQETLGPPDVVDPEDLSQAGWAVVFHGEESEEVKNALRPLTEHRSGQAGEARVLEYRGGEGWRRFLARHGVAAGHVQPSKVPYYLLLVGSPAKVPWDLQLMLSIEYAVGRLSFDSPEEYASYARSVVRTETGTAPPPALRVDPGEDFSRAVELDDDARGKGTITFLTASCAAGTPERETFSGEPEKDAAHSAGTPRVAELPARLLARPRGGALAVVGLMDRSAGPSPLPEGWLRVLRAMLDAILAGAPVGHALREIKKRHAELSTRLGRLQEKMEWGGTVADDELASVWSEWHETRSYVVLGDPAVRLRAGDRD